MSAELTSTAPPACPVAGVELPVVVLGVVDVAGGVVVASGLVALVSRRAGVVVTGGFTAAVSRGADGFALVSCVLSGATSPEGVLSTARLPALRFCMNHHTTKAITRSPNRMTAMRGASDVPARVSSLSLIHISEPTRQAEISYA